MSAENPATDAAKLRKRLMRRRALRESWPLLVWLGVIFVALWAFQKGGEFQRMQGVVSKQVDIVAPLETGLLVPIPEDLAPRDDAGNPREFKQGEWIKQGDVVAKLDDSYIEQKIQAAIETAKIDFSDRKQQAHFKNVALHNEVSDLENQIQQVTGEIDAQQARKEAVEKELGVRTTNADVAEVQVEIDSLQIQKAALERQKKRAEAQIDQGLQLIEELSALSEQLTDQNQSESLKLLDEEKKRTVITATRSGWIQKVLKQPGDVVRSGEPILEILAETDKAVTALIPEAYALSLEEGQTVYVAVPGNERNFVTAQILSLAPGLMQVEDLASPIRGRMLRGRLVELGNIENAEKMISGTRVIISLGKPGKFSIFSKLLEE